MRILLKTATEKKFWQALSQNPVILEKELKKLLLEPNYAKMRYKVCKLEEQKGFKILEENQGYITTECKIKLNPIDDRITSLEIY